MKKDRIGLVVDFSKKEAVKLANEVKDWLSKKGWIVFIKPLSDLKFSDLDIKGLSFVVTFGGDGTVLRTANALASHVLLCISIARVNFGTTGYLCNIKPKEVFQAMEKILKGQFHLETRTRIEAKVLKNKKTTCWFDAFNEIVVGSTPTKKTAWLKVTVVNYYKGRREKILRISGDGLIVATKSGSTGYCLSAGGPVLLEDAFAAVASNGHFESGFLPPYAKSFVTPSDDVWFEITVLRGGSNLPCVEADSDDERTRLLKEGEKVVISKSPYKNFFIEF